MTDFVSVRSRRLGQSDAVGQQSNAVACRALTQSQMPRMQRFKSLGKMLQDMAEKAMHSYQGLSDTVKEIKSWDDFKTVVDGIFSGSDAAEDGDGGGGGWWFWLIKIVAVFLLVCMIGWFSPFLGVVTAIGWCLSYLWSYCRPLITSVLRFSVKM